MPRTKRQEDPEHEDVEVESSERDYVMARLAAGRAATADALAQIDEALGLFVNPAEDRRGGRRRDAVETALEALGVASRAVEAADEILPDVDFEEGEPWEDDGDEGDD